MSRIGNASDSSTLQIVDINIICAASGVGASMIKNAGATSQKMPLKTLLGPNVAGDALDLVSELLIFNPHGRLTAENALKHHYVSRYLPSGTPYFSVFFKDNVAGFGARLTRSK